MVVRGVSQLEELEAQLEDKSRTQLGDKLGDKLGGTPEEGKRDRQKLLLVGKESNLPSTLSRGKSRGCFQPLVAEAPQQEREDTDWLQPRHEEGGGRTGWRSGPPH